mgnify:CR=1 FL=1
MDVSVIIPTYNRKEKLKDCLSSLFQQDYLEGNFEIIVVDDGSTDGTGEMLKGLSKERPLLKVFFQPHKGPAAARNLGIRQAFGEIVGFTDNDCVFAKDWVKKMVQAHRREMDKAAIGGFTRVDTHNIKAMVSQFLSDGAITATVNGRKEVIFFPTCNVSFKKRYLENDRFNESFPLPAGEDLEFFWRLFKKGYRFATFPDIEIQHNCHPDLRSFLKQAYSYGRGNYLVQHIHKNHPLLKEIKTKNHLFFFLATLINFIKIPRFSWILGTRLRRSRPFFSFYENLQIYVFFVLHKVMYVWGNILEHLKVTRIAPPAPECIILDITHRCNLQCRICEIRKDESLEELSTQEVKDLIDQSMHWGVKEFVLSGGEAFLREDIFGILDFVKTRRYHIGILTNGIQLNESFLRRLLPYLREETLSLSISLDAITPEIHDDIRGAKGCFEKTLRGLKILSELKKEYPAVNFNVIAIILNKNLEELLPLVNFLKSLHVNSIQLQPLLANNLIMKERSNTVKYWVSPQRWPVLDQTIDALVEFKKQNFHLLRNSEDNLLLVKKYFRGLLAQEDVRCLYATRTMLIAHNGDVTTCFDCYGNIRKKTLRSIHASSEAEEAWMKVRECKHPCLLPCFCDGDGYLLKGLL